MKHDFHERDDDLAHCKVCGGAEGSLPTDCPGVRMSPAQEGAVQRGEIDFRRDATNTGGRWWVPAASEGVPDDWPHWASVDPLTGYIDFAGSIGKQFINEHIQDQIGHGVDAERLVVRPLMIGPAMDSMPVAAVQLVGNQPFDEKRERALFEAAAYALYTSRRMIAQSRGVALVGDGANGEEAVPEQLFWLQANGEYGVLMFNAAWWGWKTARGG